jgi:hypothetical protein
MAQLLLALACGSHDKIRRMNFWKGIYGLAICLFFSSLTTADEGMWLLNGASVDLLKQKYDFVLTSQWLEHAQKSAVRFNSG